MVLQRLADRRARWRLAPGLALVAVCLPVLATPAEAAVPPARDIHRFNCPDDLTSPFTDIAGHVHEDAIECQFFNGLISGTSDTTFSPDTILSRGQMATFLAKGLRAAGLSLNPTDQGFTDIAGNVHEDNINAIAGFGIARGTTETTFSPDLPVRRDQLASFLNRAIALAEQLPVGEDVFVDDNGNTHEANINALANAGIVQGVGDDRYAPEQPVGRGAASSFLTRTRDLGIEHGFLQPLGPYRMLRSALTGEAERPEPGEEGAIGDFVMQTNAVPGVVCYDFEIHQIAGTPTAAHIHRGGRDEAGPVVVTLISPPHGVSRGCLGDVDEALIAELYESPQDFYVNVHTAEHPDGAIRGQLAARTGGYVFSLFPEEVVPGPGAPDAGEQPVTVLTLSEPDMACFWVNVYLEGATAVHVHEAPAGEVGDVVLTLRSDQFGWSYGCYAGVDADVLDRIEADASGFYIDVHTAEHPDGAVRGQLHKAAPNDFELSPEAEVPGPGDPFGKGWGFVDVVAADRVCYFIHARGIELPAAAAHVHHAPAGEAGPVVITLITPFDNGQADDCIDGLDEALVADIAANPEQYYVNIHTTEFPDGAVRGQLHAKVW